MSVDQPLNRGTLVGGLGAAGLAAQRERPLPVHRNDGEEAHHPDRIANHRKGSPHDVLGLVDPGSYAGFARFDGTATV